MSNVIHLLTRRPITSLDEVLPRPAECLACFVDRMVREQGCTDSLRFVEQYRQERAKRATALTRRLVAWGAVCDCALTKTIWRLHPELWDWDVKGELVEPSNPPHCAGVRPNSTQPCAHWVRAADIALG